MIVYFGTRLCGKADEVHGEYAATRVFHVYWLPLVPLGWTWVIGADRDGDVRGHEMRFHWRSLLAAFGRTWGVVLGSVGLLAGQPLFVVGGSALALGTLLLRRLRTGPGQLAERRLFGAVAGTHCAPEDLPEPLARALLEELRAAWGERYRETVQDVARFGTDDAAKAAHAYALLRLEGLRSGSRELRELAGRLARAGGSSRPVVGEGPYRARLLG